MHSKHGPTAWLGAIEGDIMGRSGARRGVGRDSLAEVAIPVELHQRGARVLLSSVTHGFAMVFREEHRFVKRQAP